MFDFQSIIEHVVTNDFIVRPEARNLVNIVDALATQSLSRPVFITSMRLLGAIPEEPRLIRFYLPQEILEVACVVDAGHRFGWPGIDLFRAIRLSDQFARIAILIHRCSRSPPFAGLSRLIAILAQYLRPSFEFNGELDDVIGGFLKLPGIATGQDARTRRGALRIGRVRILKENALLRQTIERGRMHPLASVSAHVHVGRVVHDTEKDVRTVVIGRLQRETSQR